MSRFTKLNFAGETAPADAAEFVAVHDALLNVEWHPASIAVDNWQQAQDKAADGFIHTCVREDLEEHLSPTLPWATAAQRLIDGMRVKWRETSGSLMPLPIIADGPNR